MSVDGPRAAPNTFTRRWPEGPFESASDPIGAGAAELMARIAGQLAYRRRFLGQTQESIGREAGVSHYTISRIESGSAWPRWDTMLALCEVLGVFPSLLTAKDASGPDSGPAGSANAGDASADSRVVPHQP